MKIPPFVIGQEQYSTEIPPAQPPRRFQTQKSRSAKERLLTEELSLGRSADGAILSAGAARNAGIRVDDVLAVAFLDRLNGALLCTSAAGDARITDNICHSKTPPLIFFIIIPFVVQKSNTQNAGSHGTFRPRPRVFSGSTARRRPLRTARCQRRRWPGRARSCTVRPLRRQCAGWDSCAPASAPQPPCR